MAVSVECVQRKMVRSLGFHQSHPNVTAMIPSHSSTIPSLCAGQCIIYWYTCWINFIFCLPRVDTSEIWAAGCLMDSRKQLQIYTTTDGKTGSKGTPNCPGAWYRVKPSYIMPRLTLKGCPVHENTVSKVSGPLRLRSPPRASVFPVVIRMDMGGIQCHSLANNVSW